jgi:hypothetical protein
VVQVVLVIGGLDVDAGCQVVAQDLDLAYSIAESLTTSNLKPCLF